VATYGFVYDQTRCIGCNACQMACKDGHDLELSQFFRRVQTLEYTDDQGQLVVMHYSGCCNHCQDAPCVEHCPTGAMHRQEDGTVAVEQEKCIGCSTCTWVCPYGAPKVSHKTGRSMKCDACLDRRKEGKEPLCVEACLTHCLKLIDLKTLSDEEKERYTNTLPILPSPEKTHPNLLILVKEGGASW